MSLKQIFGENLRIIRKRRGLTQYELAEKVNLSVEFIGLLERGKNAPSFSTIENLSKALDVNPSVFFRSNKNKGG